MLHAVQYQLQAEITMIIGNLERLKTYATMFPDVILGLSDDTPAVALVAGAVTLGARGIEVSESPTKAMIRERPGP